MSVGIIIRPSGYHHKKASPRFVPHYNRSMERYYGSSKEYYSDLKAKGLEPYDPSAKDSGKRSPYKASEKCRGLIEAIKSHTKKGKFSPSDNLIKGMESIGVKTRMTREDLRKLPAHYKSGGFDNKSEKK